METAIGGGAGGGNGHYVLYLVVVYHEAVGRTVLFVQALVNATSAFFAVVETTAIVELSCKREILVEDGTLTSSVKRSMTWS